MPGLQKFIPKIREIFQVYGAVQSGCVAKPRFRSPVDYVSVSVFVKVSTQPYAGSRLSKTTRRGPKSKLILCIAGYAEREMGAKNSADVVPKPEPQVKQPADKARAFEEAIAPKPDERAYTFRDPATKRNRRLIEFRLYAAPLKDRKKRMRELILDDKRSGCKPFYGEKQVF